MAVAIGRQTGIASSHPGRTDLDGTSEELRQDLRAATGIFPDREVPERQDEALVCGAHGVKKRGISWGLDVEDDAEGDHRRTICAQQIQHAGVVGPREIAPAP